MKVWCRIAALMAAAALTTPVTAAAADYCVGLTLAGCQPRDHLASALADAKADATFDRVLLGAGAHEVPPGPADAPGAPVEIEGRADGVELVPEQAGSAATLELREPASRLTGVAVAPAGVRAVIAAGTLRLVIAEGPVELLAGGRLADAGVQGGVIGGDGTRVARASVLGSLRAEGEMVVEDVDIVADGGAAIEAACGPLTVRHVTLTGQADVALRSGCQGEPALMELHNSVVHGSFDDIAAITSTEATIRSFRSAHPEDAEEVEAVDRIDVADPGFLAPGDRRLAATSPLVDAGAPEPLAAGEGSFDAAGDMRVVDGDGDGSARRDIGAFERQAPAPGLPAGNVLANPGGEDAAPGAPPPGWTATGTIGTLAYGTVDRSAAGGDVVMPTRAAGAALAAGGAFFSGDGTLLQRIDVSASAGQIDAGGASAVLSGLVGGYGRDEDEVRVRATFRDPEGTELVTISIGPVAPAERANATMLVHRSAGGAIPPRTRAIDVAVTGTRVGAPGSSESYTDAFADNLGLQLTVPGTPVPGPVDPSDPPVPRLKPFNGITVLTARPILSRRGRARIRVACASATVGRCRGTFELRAQLLRGMAFTRVARFHRFSIAPGRTATRTLRLTLEARRILRRRRSFRATLRAIVRDGQGLERRTTIPLRMRRRR